MKGAKGSQMPMAEGRKMLEQRLDTPPALPAGSPEAVR